MRKFLVFSFIVGFSLSLFSMELKVGKADIGCSLLVQKGIPAAKITSSMDKEFKITSFSDGSIVFVKGGNLEDGKTYLIVSKRGSLPSGYFVYRMVGYGKILRHEAKYAVMQLVTTCSAVRLGDYVMEFTPEEEFTIKEEPLLRENAGPSGEGFKIVFLESEFAQVGDGGWAIIDGGEKQGLKKGDILLIFRPLNKVKKPIAKAIVLRTVPDYSVIKIFSSIDAVLLKDLVYKK